MLIVFLGPPGAGKGTQAQRLRDYLGVAHLSTGEMMRDAARAGSALGMQAANIMKAGELVPDEVVIGVVADRLRQQDCARGFLLDGFPRTLPQAKALDDSLAEHHNSLDIVLALEVPAERLVARLLARGRMDDNEATIHERFRQYARLTEPLLDYYRERGILSLVDGDGTPDEVFTRIKAAVDAARG